MVYWLLSRTSLLISCEGFSDEPFLERLASLVSRSEHPSPCLRTLTQEREVIRCVRISIRTEGIRAGAQRPSLWALVLPW